MKDKNFKNGTIGTGIIGTIAGIVWLGKLFMICVGLLIVTGLGIWIYKRISK